MKTNTIHSFNDLKQFGIDILTGESCALSRRLLCDVTEEGRNLVIKALGVPDISLSAPWNDGVGSILLERDTLKTLCILALFEDKNCLEVWEFKKDGSFHGLDLENLGLWNDYDKNENADNYEKIRKYKLFNSKDRNVHQFSGRVN